MTSRTTLNTYEAAWYLMHGATLREVVERTQPRKKVQRKMYSKQWVLTLDNIPEEAITLFLDGRAVAPVRDLEAARTKLKRKVKKLLNAN